MAEDALQQISRSLGDQGMLRMLLNMQPQTQHAQQQGGEQAAKHAQHHQPSPTLLSMLLAQFVPHNLRAVYEVWAAHAGQWHSSEQVCVCVYVMGTSV